MQTKEITYNGDTVIVDVCLVVKLFFDFCVALVGSKSEG
jgi:hypothetical protein